MSVSIAKKTALILVGLIVLSLFTLIFFKDTIVQHVAVKVTSHTPFRIQELSIERLGLREINIKRLRAHFIEDTRETTIDVENALLEFASWMDLPGSIRQLSIEDGFVQIDVKSGQNSQQDVTPQAKRAGETIDEWIRLVNSVDASIDRLEVVYSEDYKKLLFEMIGSVKKHSNQWLIDSRIGVLESFLGHANFQVKEDGQYQISLQELESQKPVIEIDGKLQPIEDGMQISGSSEIHLSTLQALAETSLPQLDGWHIEDRTTMRFELKVPLSPRSLAELVTGNFDAVSSGSIFHASQGSSKYEVNVSCQLQSVLAQRCSIPEKLHTSFTADSKVNNRTLPLQSISFDFIPDQKFAVDLDWLKNSVQLGGGIRLTGSTVGPNSDFDIRVADLMARYSAENFSTHGDYSLQLQLAEITGPFVARQVRADAKGNFQWLEQVAQITANKGSTFSLAKLFIDKTELDAAKFQLTNQLTWKGDQTTWHTSPVKLSAKLAKLLQDGEVLVTPGSGEITLSDMTMSNSQINARAEYFWKDIKAHAPKIAVPLQDLAGNLSIRGNQVHSKGEARFGAHKDKILYEASVDTKTAAGALQITCPDLQLNQNQTLNRLIASTGYPLSLEQGTVAVALRSRWTDQSSSVQTHIDLTVRGAAGSYAQLPFEGFNVQAAIAGAEQWQLQKATTVELQRAFFGVPVENVHIDISSLRLHSDQQLELIVPRMGMDTLGGSVFARDITFDSDKEENRVLLKLSNLSLEELVKYQKSKDLYLSGYLLGELPIVYSHGVITVDDGNLSADDSGGVIRYLNLEHLKAAKADLSIVSDMLKNFHYQALTASASLSPDGDVMLKTHLQGKNPDLETAEVNLNFNIEFNLPSALKTAKLLYFVDKDIEAYIRSQRKK